MEIHYMQITSYPQNLTTKNYQQNTTAEKYEERKKKPPFEWQL